MRTSPRLSIITLVIIIVVIVTFCITLINIHKAYTRENKLRYYIDRMNKLFNKSICLNMDSIVAIFKSEDRLKETNMYAKAVLNNVTYIREILNKSTTMTYIRIGYLKYRLNIISDSTNNTQIIESRDLSIELSYRSKKIVRTCVEGLIRFEKLVNNNEITVNNTYRINQCIVVHISERPPENAEARRIIVLILAARALAELYFPEIVKNVTSNREIYVNGQKCIMFVFTGKVNISKAIINGKIVGYILKMTHMKENETLKYLTQLARTLVRKRLDTVLIKYRTCILNVGIPVTQSITIQGREGTIKVSASYMIKNLKVMFNVSVPRVVAPVRPITNVVLVRTLDVATTLAQVVRQVLSQVLLNYIAVGTVLR
ncbi:MAG: hypothetical protein GXO23_00985 [Crenarchaeota archaeon]|nr:hypothetical protein [Thermoproteota archaeon]